jgi:phosphatidylglycerophosphate synthase
MPSSKPSIAELREVCQPPELIGRRSAEHWAGRLYMRRLSLHATRQLVRLPVSANALTGLMILTGLAAAGTAAVPAWWTAVLAALLIQLYLLLDCSDGEVARWRGTTGPMGAFLDRIGHYVVEATLVIAIGIRAEDAFPGMWTALGLLGAVLIILIKAQTDLVTVARASAGLPPPGDAAATPRSGGVRTLRRIAFMLPVHRLLGAVELSLALVIAAAVDAIRGSLGGTQALLVIVVLVAAAVSVGHFVAILSSERLR